MPKKAKELSIKEVEKLIRDSDPNKESRHAVGGAAGLHIRIAGNSRAWVLRVLIGSSRRDIGLGGYPEVSLANARKKANELRNQIRDGIDPLHEKRERRKEQAKLAHKQKTFAECVEAVLQNKSSELKNAKHLAQWRSSLETYVYPQLGQKAVSQITKADVLSVLEPIWLTKNETASRVRGRIETVLDYAKAKEYREGDNPAAWKGMLKPLLPQPSKVQKKKHHAALPYREAGTFMAKLRKREGISARALEFSILTAARSGEVRGATWDEIDLKACTWTIPVERMKAGKEHRVPLSEDAVSLLKALPRIVGNNLVFPAPRGGQLSDMSLTAVLKRMERGDLTQHGFRSTFRDWAGETTSYPREVIEHALAHQLKDKAEAAYQRGDLLNKRANLMADWANHCNSEASNVVSIDKGVA